MTSTEKTLPSTPAAAPVAPAKPVVSKKPAPKAAAKPAAKTKAAAKPAAAKAKMAVAKKPVASAPKKASVAAAKPAPKTSAKPAVKPAAKPAAVKTPKAKKPKMVRDSFTIPKPEYDVLNVLKLRAAKLGSPVKKTELIRAGVKAIAALSDAAFKQALLAVPSLKTGRPAKAKKA